MGIRVGTNGTLCCNCKHGMYATEQGFKQADCTPCKPVFCKKRPYLDNGDPRMSRDIAENCYEWEKQDD